jgi:hypothetical protein
MWSWGSDAADRDGIGDQEELMEELESKEHAEQTPDADKAGSVEETVKSAADSARDVPGVDAMPASEAEKAPVLGEEASQKPQKHRWERRLSLRRSKPAARWPQRLRQPRNSKPDPPRSPSRQ